MENDQRIGIKVKLVITMIFLLFAYLVYHTIMTGEAYTAKNAEL